MNVCKNCTAQVTEKFCGRCGEKVYTDSDKSFKHLFEEAFHFMTHAAYRFFKFRKLINGLYGLLFCTALVLFVQFVYKFILFNVIINLV